MGVYNTYNNVELKVGSNEMEEYQLGDNVDIGDGIYVGFEGVIVVSEGILVAKFKELTTKWGDIIKPRDLLEDYHPLKEAVEKAKKKKKR